MGVDWRLSLPVIWGQQGIKSPLREFDMVRLLDSQDGRNGFIRRENAQCGKGSAGFHFGRFEAKGIFLVCGCWRELCLS